MGKERGIESRSPEWGKGLDWLLGHNKAYGSSREFRPSSWGGSSHRRTGCCASHGSPRQGSGCGRHHTTEASLRTDKKQQTGGESYLEDFGNPTRRGGRTSGDGEGVDGREGGEGDESEREEFEHDDNSRGKKKSGRLEGVKRLKEGAFRG